MKRYSTITFLLFTMISMVITQTFGQDCSNNAYRKWWDVYKYKYHLHVGIEGKTPPNTAVISARIVEKSNDTLQIDLQEPMRIITVVDQRQSNLKIYPIENGSIVVGPFSKLNINDTIQFLVQFDGCPTAAQNPPWSGGLTETIDSLHNKWMSISTQNGGASMWLPCKDYYGDEPENGVELHFYYPKQYQLFTNGVWQNDFDYGTQYKQSIYVVNHSINLYNITFYLGKYTSWNDTLVTGDRKLPITYAALNYHANTAKTHFEQVKQTLQTFENLYGPYPFYKDGFKIIEAPYLGMEHQGAIAYGNRFQNGYLGKDRSNTSVGLLFDFIIVHEIAHEWFGNSITASHPAYSWIQEGFTTYAEVQYIEQNFGHDKAIEYLIGKQAIIKNDFPLIDTNNLCNNPTTDQYDKGANIIHMIRLQMNNDTVYNNVIKKMLRIFGSSVVSSNDIESFLLKECPPINTAFFNQYLRTTLIPKLKIQSDQKHTLLSFENVVEQFKMKIPVVDKNGKIQFYTISNKATKITTPINKATRKLWKQYLITVA